MPTFEISLVGILLGAALFTVLGWFFTGLVNSAGSDAWAWLKRMVRPPPAADVEVAASYSAAHPDCAWIEEHVVLGYAARGWVHVMHHEKGGRVWSREPFGARGVRAFLMKRPPDDAQVRVW